MRTERRGVRKIQNTQSKRQSFFGKSESVRWRRVFENVRLLRAEERRRRRRFTFAKGKNIARGTPTGWNRNR